MSAAIRSIGSVPIKSLTADEQTALACEIRPGGTVNVLRLAQSLGAINEAAADTMASIDSLCDAVLALLPEQPSNRRYFAARTLLDQDIRGAVGRLVELIDGASTRCELQPPPGSRHA